MLERQLSAVRPVAEATSVAVLRSVKEIDTIRSYWSSTMGTRDSDLDIFLTLQRSPEVVRPHVVVMYRNGLPTALLGGRVVRTRLPFRVGFLKIAEPLVKMIVFPYGALRGSGSVESCNLLVSEVLKSLSQGDADLAVFEHAAADSELAQCVTNMSSVFLRDHFSPVRVHRRRLLPPNIAAHYASLSPSERKRFRQITSKLSAEFQGRIELVKFERTSDLVRLMQDVEIIAKKAWQRSLGFGFNATEALLEFLNTEACKGWLRTYVLYLDGRPCSFWIGAVYQQTFYSDFTGYDPDYARYSLGTYLFSQMLEDLCNGGVSAFDFGFTDDEYKRRFANDCWRETSLSLYAHTPRGFRLASMRTVTLGAHETIRALLERAKLTQRVKKFWRKSVKKETENQSAA